MSKKILIIAIVIALSVSMMLMTVGCDTLGKDQVPGGEDNVNIDGGNTDNGNEQPSDENGDDTPTIEYANKNMVKFVNDNFAKFLAVDDINMATFNGAVVSEEIRDAEDYFDSRVVGYLSIRINTPGESLYSYLVFLDQEYAELDAELKEFITVDMAVAEYELKGDIVVSGNCYDDFLQLDTSGVDKTMLENTQKAFDDMLATKCTIYFRGSDSAIEMFNAVSDGNCDSYYNYVKIDEAERDNKLLNWNNEKDNYTQDSYCYYENGYLVTWYTYKEGLSYTLSSDGLSYAVKRYSYTVDDEKNVVIPSEHNGKPVTGISVMAFVSIKGLKSITIPNSIEKFAWIIIGDCTDLTTINYQGTMEQWRAIEKNSFWEQNNSVDFAIHCTDGDIAKE